MALTAGAPVIPVGIYLDHGRIRFLRTQIDGQTEVARWYVGGPYAVTVGKPMYFEGDVEERPYVRAISRQIMERIAALSEEGARRMEQARQKETLPSGLFEWGKLLGDAR